MDRQGLQQELARLRRGRGLTRPGLLESLGPQLRAVLGVGRGSPEPEVRARLTVLLTEEVGGLPVDLRMLAQAAYGLTSSERLLYARVAQTPHADVLNERTLRRRMNEADRLLADRLVLRQQGRRGLVTPGWDWGLFRHEGDMRGRPTVVSRRVLIPLVDGLSEYEEIIGLPGGDPGAVTVDAVAGCALAGATPVSTTGLRLTFALPRALSAGEPHETVVRFVWADRSHIRPVLALNPYRRVARFEVSVDFGEPRVCSRAWRLDGVLPTSVDAPQPDALVDDSVATYAADQPIFGHCYGIGWSWA